VSARDAVPLLEVHGLSRRYALPRTRLFEHAPRVPALIDVSFTLHGGRSLGVVGESGSGKSTLARLVAALEPPSAGRVIFEGRDLHALPARELRAARRDMQMVFQDPYGSLDPRQRIARVVGEPLEMLEDVAVALRRERVVEALEAVGLAAADLDKYPHEFSGGQRQRIAIARALVTRPKLIVADEPVSALDVSVQAQVLNLMQDLQERFGLTYLFISHDLAVVDLVCDEVIVLYRGRVVEHAPADRLFQGAAHPYTRALLAAVPDEAFAGAGSPRIRLPVTAADATTAPAGDPGDGGDAAPPPRGCTFAPRCALRHQRCLRENPELRAVAPGHHAACHVAESVLSQETTLVAEPRRNR
jgi:peptide/nickel transport system ATP-binding protein